MGERPLRFRTAEMTVEETAKFAADYASVELPKEGGLDRVTYFIEVCLASAFKAGQSEPTEHTGAE